jgi:hypothetical protein
MPDTYAQRPVSGYSLGGIPAGTYAPFWTEQRIIYVGKHGLDTNTGLSIYAAKLTIQAAIAQAVANGAGAGTPFVVLVLDDGIYAENLTLAQYVHVRAANAVLTGTVTAANNTSLILRQHTLAAGAAYTLNVGGATNVFYKTQVTACTGAANAVLVGNATDVLQAEIEQLSVVNGTAVEDRGAVIIRAGRIIVDGNGIAVSRPANDVHTEVYAGFLGNGAAGTGTILDCQAGVIVLHVEQLYTRQAAGGVAWNIGAAGSLRGRIEYLTYTGTPTRTLNAVCGYSLEIGNFGYPNGAWRTINNAATGYAIVDPDGAILLDTTAGVVNVVLPVAANRRNQRFEVKWDLGANAATVTVAGGGTIDGAAGYLFAVLKNAITVESNDTEWKIV